MADLGPDKIDLCVCARDGEACCDCLAGTFFPCIMYGLNYNRATEKNCCLPCCSHMCADCVVSAAASACAAGAAQPLHVPLGCLLRASHRQALAKDEHVCVSVLVEAFCWGCSMAQVRQYLKTQPKGQFDSTSSVLGLIKNSMAHEEDESDRLRPRGV